MSVDFKVEDYVWVEKEGRNYKGMVTKKREKDAVLVIEEKLPYEEVELLFDNKEIIANLGKKPSHKILHTFYKSKSCVGVGKVHFFLRIDDKGRSKFVDIIEKGYKELKRKGLVAYFPMNMEVRPENGKKLGHYKVDKKSDLDTMTMYANEESDYLETFFHESGHGVWNRMITKRDVKSKWIDMHRSYISVRTLDTVKLKKIRNEIRSLNLTVSEYKKSLETDDDKLILKEILGYIKKYRHLSIMDLDDIIEARDYELFHNVWPRDSVALSKIKETGITAYSLKNPQEFFCEAFSFYMKKKELPSSVKRLMEKTLEHAASR
jgi:hypothetical protein